MSSQQHSAKAECSTSNGKSPSGSSTSGALTPTSSQEETTNSSNERLGPFDDTPLSSIEHDIDALSLNGVNVTVSPPSATGNPATSLIQSFHDLRSGNQTAAISDRQTSLTPELGRGQSSEPTRRRRSSSRNPVQRHELDQEELPESDYFRRDFQEALSQSRALASQLADSLSSSDLYTDASSVIHELYGTARSAAAYQGPKSWKIGLVGDSGAGKSSLINSLLDIKAFARTSNGGSACTCTVTEYHYHESPTFAIEIVYFSEERLLDQFAELLQAYRRFHNAPVEDNEENQALQEAASVAWYTLKAGFKNQASLTESHLLQESEQTLGDNFASWINQSAPQGFSDAGARPNTYRENIANEAECSARLLQITSEPLEEGVAASWPYIERVNVFLRANILSKGLILVDLPGLRDTNSARRLITERYIINCDEVFAIANIGRAATDVGVKAVVDLATRTKRRYVGIVCTKSDDYEPDEASLDFKGAARSLLLKLKMNVRGSELKLQSIVEDLQDDLDEYEELELHRQRRVVERERNDHQYLLKKHIVAIRNDKVAAELRRLYSPIARNVFCISNAFYRDNRDGDREASLKWLQLSGIIALRKHCLGLVAEQQLQGAMTFMKDLVPNLVSAISLWVQSGSGQITTETRRQVRDASGVVDNILHLKSMGIRSLSDKFSTTLHDGFHRRVLSQFTTERDSQWRLEARYAAEDWNTWHHASYAAFCRKYGDHCTAAVGSRCWNGEIIAGMVADLIQPWSCFRKDTAKLFMWRNGLVGDCFDQALAPLQAINVTDPENLASVQTLITTIFQKKNLVREETSRLVAEYERALVQLGNADLLANVRTSFIGQHMESGYRAAAQDYGRGVHARQKSVINAKVRDPNVFQIMRQKLEEQFQELSLDVETKIREAAKKHFLAVRSAVDTLRNTNAETEAEQDPAFRERIRKSVEDAERQLRGILAAVCPRG